MTDALNPTVPAGWYPDPWGSTAQRWWDGHAWTESLHPAPTDAPEHSHSAESGVPQAATQATFAAATEPVSVASFTLEAENFEPAPFERVSATPDGAASHYDPHHARHSAPTYGDALPVPDAPAPDLTAAPAYQSAPAPSVATPFVADSTPLPSRRTLRELGVMTETIPVVGAKEFVEPVSSFSPAAPLTAEPTPPFTQAPLPNFTPEPVSTLPPPVWTSAGEVTPAVEPASALPVTSKVASAFAPPVTEVTTSSDATPATPAFAPPASVIPPVEAAAVSVPAAVATAAPVPSSSAPQPADTDSWAASLANWGEVETFTAPPDAPPIFGDSPPISYSQRSTRYQPPHGRTSAVWLIVVMPIIHAVAAVGGLFVVPGMSAMFTSPAALAPTAETMAALIQWTLFVLLPLSIVIPVLTLVLAFQDRAHLRLLGHDSTASPWWTLLTPLVYLIVRSVRVRQSTGRKGSGPLTTFICLNIAPGIAVGIASVVINAIDGAIPT